MVDRTENAPDGTPQAVVERVARPVAWFNYALIALTVIAIVIGVWAWVAGTSPARQDAPAPTTPAGRPVGPPAQ